VARFQQGAVPENLEERAVTAPGAAIKLTAILKELGLVSSASEAGRKIQEGAVRVNQEKIANHQHELAAGETYILSVGKRAFAKVRVLRNS
jgi:tyrosyl-tRNA synthetase